MNNSSASSLFSKFSSISLLFPFVNMMGFVWPLCAFFAWTYDGLGTCLMINTSLVIKDELAIPLTTENIVNMSNQKRFPWNRGWDISQRIFSVSNIHHNSIVGISHCLTFCATSWRIDLPCSCSSVQVKHVKLFISQLFLCPCSLNHGTVLTKKSNSNKVKVTMFNVIETCFAFDLSITMTFSFVDFL